MRSKTMTDIWQDRNIGSVLEPMYYSQACDCE